MERSEVAERTRATAARVLDAAPEQLPDDAVLREVGPDSLALVELALALEDEFGIALDEQDLGGVETLGGYVDVVETKLARQG